MWVACPNSERCDGGVDVELEAVSDGEEPSSLVTVAGAVATDDGRHCDHGCELTAEQLAVVCHIAARDFLLDMETE